jgi:myo-inositol-1(or 4)-monophosphatase
MEVDAFLRDHAPRGPPRLRLAVRGNARRPGQRAASRVFIVDPIDGTRAYIGGEATWAHSLAVVEDGRPVAAVVHLPVRKKTYAAALGHGATLNGAPCEARTGPEVAGSTFLAARASFEPQHWKGAVPQVDRAFRPSLAYRLALVGEGRFDGMLTLRPTWEWDVAAGALIATEAGARVTDRRGRPLAFNAPDPRLDGVLAAGRDLHAAVHARMA